MNIKTQGQYYLARWWEPTEGDRVLCNLCPRLCNIPAGSHGFCIIRKNRGGKLYNTAYGKSTGFAVDPIEKKPLYHFYPGSNILSFGTIGCNMGCKFCQNWHISKVHRSGYDGRFYSPDDVVQLALKQGCIGIAFTYNEPVIFSEWVIDIARSARASGLKNVLVTNGYVTPQARNDLYQFIDGANVDLKSFSEQFYRQLTLSHLQPVLDTLRWLANETDVWIEITNLLIPGKNDSASELDQLTGFIAKEIGTDVPLHLSAFHPDFKMMNTPSTPLSALIKAKKIAISSGLNFVYLGNVYSNEGQNTVCPLCRKAVIKRNIYNIQAQHLENGCCAFCQTQIPGQFTVEI